MKKLDKLSEKLRAGLSGDNTALDDVNSMLYEHLNSIVSDLALSKNKAQHRSSDIQLTEKMLQSMQLQQVEISDNERAHILAMVAGQIRRVLFEMNNAANENKDKDDDNESFGLLARELSDLVKPKKIADFVQLDRVLQQLSELDQRKATLFELSYFGGMSYEQIAEVQTISIATIDREIRFARAWVSREITA